MGSARSNSTQLKPAPKAVLLFLKHAALDREWETAEIRKTLAVDSSTAKEIANQFQLMGYAEPVPRKSSAWRNTKTGNSVAGVRTPRLTQSSAAELLTDVADRAEAYNLKADAPLRIAKIVAFGAINGKHEKIQNVDLGVQIEPRGENPISNADRSAAFKELRGRSTTLKVHPLEALNGMLGKWCGRRESRAPWAINSPSPPLPVSRNHACAHDAGVPSRMLG